jgi:hypothetical protein
MNAPREPEPVGQAMVTPRWAGLVRLDTDLATIGSWDPGLLRDTRLLVPVDVQALYVPPGTAEPMVRLPFDLTTREGDPPPPPEPFIPGLARPPGVHLHWAVPDALLRGTLTDPAPAGAPPPGGSPTAVANRLSMPALPDRWLVLRILLPAKGNLPLVRGWVLEAEAARAVPVERWPQDAEAFAGEGRAVAAEALTGTAGGSLAWTTGYDATVNRLALHDPLDDLAEVDAQGGPVGDLATYVVCGWWSVPALDPLDGVWQSASLDDLLHRLGWTLVSDAEGGSTGTLARSVDAQRRASLGLATGDRFGGPAGSAAGLVARAAAGADALSGSAYRPASGAFLTADATVVQAAEVGWPRSCLLHGLVCGVPVRGGVPVDARPRPDALRPALGKHGGDVAAALVAPGFGATTLDQRRAVERLVVAFTGQLLPRLGSRDGVVDIEEHEHAAGFAGLPGGDGEMERLSTNPAVATARFGRLGRTTAGAEAVLPSVSLAWAGRTRMDLVEASAATIRDEALGWLAPGGLVAAPQAEVREVRRPAPRFHLAVEPVFALGGARRSLRHGGDGRFSPDGLLQCRWPSQVVEGMPNMLLGAELLPTLGNGALPPEAVTVAREALLLAPYHAEWLAAASARLGGVDPAAARARFVAEAVLRFGRDGVYTGDSPVFVGLGGPAEAGPPAARQAAVAGSPVTAAQVADQLRRFSAFQGVDPDPVAVTAWAQPWIPLWLEWEIQLVVTDRLAGWALGPVDLAPAGEQAAPLTRTVAGRSLLTTGAATALASAVTEWLLAEEARDRAGTGEADEITEDRLSSVAAAVQRLDVVSATLDGLREALLGLPYRGGLVRPRSEDGTVGGPVPVGPPQLMVAGALRVLRARIVDAFGRTLDVPVGRIAIPARDLIPDGRSDPSAAGALRLRPRLTRPARWMFRLVDAASTEPRPTEARVDQVDPARMVSPVSGWLLPDHIDEALEAFDATGAPLGQLLHDAIGGGVAWEIAPGRAGPADAGPSYGLAAAQRPVGWLAAGLVAADARFRAGAVADPGVESALSALLRAIDTTLWTVDPFAGLGTEHIAGLVGRPVAVVRARLWLDLRSDLDELDLSDPALRAEREHAFAEFADRAFPVRLGELTRSDDGLLAYFVDDDYTRAYLVDRVLRELAFDTGRMRGQLGAYGHTPRIPGRRPIEHPYLAGGDQLRIHPGQVVTLTLLMHPASRVHLTSGVLPRKSLALARDWVAPALAAMASSVRIGPVLVDPAQVRLPVVSALPREQVFTRRDTPYTWRDDPILAATQSALLPDLPAEVQEGYIRVAPIAEPAEGPG